jgi:fatty acid-binding protein DegV
MRAARPSATVEIPAAELGPVIGVHGGPGTLGVFWFDDEE